MAAHSALQSAPEITRLLPTGAAMRGFPGVRRGAGLFSSVGLFRVHETNHHFFVSPRHGN